MKFIKLNEVPPSKKGELFWTAYVAYDEVTERQFPGSNMYMRTLDSPPEFLEALIFTPVPDNVPSDLESEKYTDQDEEIPALMQDELTEE